MYYFIPLNIYIAKIYDCSSSYSIKVLNAKTKTI